MVVIAYKNQHDLLNSPLPFHLILDLFHSAQYETVDLKVPAFKHSPLKDRNTMFGMVSLKPRPHLQHFPPNKHEQTEQTAQMLQAKKTLSI